MSLGNVFVSDQVYLVEAQTAWWFPVDHLGTQREFISSTGGYIEKTHAVEIRPADVVLISPITKKDALNTALGPAENGDTPAVPPDARTVIVMQHDVVFIKLDLNSLFNKEPEPPPAPQPKSWWDWILRREPKKTEVRDEITPAARLILAVPEKISMAPCDPKILIHGARVLETAPV